MFSCQIISQWSDNVLALGPVDAGKYNKQFSHYKEDIDRTVRQQEDMKFIFPFQLKNILFCMIKKSNATSKLDFFFKYVDV